MKIKSLHVFSTVLLPVSIAAFIMSSCASNGPKPPDDEECVGDVAMMMGAMGGMGMNSTNGTGMSGMGMSGTGMSGMGMSGMGMSGMGMNTGTGTTTGSTDGDEETKVAAGPCDPANKAN